MDPASGRGGPLDVPGSTGKGSGRPIADSRTSAPAALEVLEASEIAKLTADDADELDHLGTSVAVHGGTLIAGAFRDSHEAENNAGSAYIFVRDLGGAGGWTQVAKLIGSDTASCDYFGSSVAISGDTAVVGARHHSPAGLSEAGSAYIFMRDQGGANAWGQVAELTAGDAEPGDSFGLSVAISGDTVVVGAAWEDANGLYHAGSAYVFMRDFGGADAWGQVVKLTASDAGEKDAFGTAVAIEGDTMVVGAVGDIHLGLPGVGSASIFMRNLGGADNWGWLTTITGSDLEAGDEFGTSVAISGDSLVVGVAGYAGEKAYVFDRDLGGNDAWGQVAKLTASDGGSNDDFGQSVAIDRDAVVVGAEFGGVEGQSAAGSAYVFLRDQGGANAWGEAGKLGASDADNEDRFGVSVAIDNSIAVIGANGDDDTGLTNPGSVYVFELIHPSIPLFADGFESGDTAAWSASMP
ncbi:MAG: FG-GAP repeat protein [Planctomycetota bacterium]